MTTEIIKEIQRHLGVDDDGIAGPVTWAAIAKGLGLHSVVASREPSKRIKDFIKGFESLRLQAYMPTANDVPTIGWGSTGPDIKMGMVWTEAQADARFERDMGKFASAVSSGLGSAPTTQDQFDAMVSLAYNIGAEAFKESTLRRLHKEGDYAGAAAQFGRWNKQAGHVLNGLTRRRAAEERIYRGVT